MNFRIQIRPSLQIILIVFLGIVAYGNSVKGKFIWDDEFIVKNNVYIRSWSNIPKILSESMGSGGKENTVFYRPLQEITYTIDHSFYKLDPAGFHITNILLHILVALSIYWLVNIIFSSRMLAFFTAALFVVDPITTEAVSFISNRAEALVTLFILLAVGLYVKYLKSNNISLYILMLIAFVLALLSKENSLILPILLLLYHYVFKIRVRARHFLTLLIISGAYLLCRAAILKSSFLNYIHPAILLQRIPAFFVAIADYLSLLIFPFNLHLEYGYTIFTFLNPKVIAGAAAAVLLIIYAFLRRKDNALISFSIFWFFLTLLPVSNIYPLNASYMAERWLYLPAIGLIMILAYGVCLLYRKLKLVSLLFIIAILGFYSYLTIKQNEYWAEPISFYKKTLEYNPGSWKIYSALGSEYMSIGNYARAAAVYQRSLELIPNIKSADPALNAVYQASRDAAAQMVIRNLNNADQALAQVKESAFKRGAGPSFRLANRYYEDANEYMAIGREKEAIPLYNEALRLDAGNLALGLELGKAYIAVGRYKEAIALLKRILESNPGIAIIHNNLAVAYYFDKDYDLALMHTDKAIALGYAVENDFLNCLKPYQGQK